MKKKSEITMKSKIRLTLEIELSCEIKDALSVTALNSTTYGSDVASRLLNEIRSYDFRESIDDHSQISIKLITGGYTKRETVL